MGYYTNLFDQYNESIEWQEELKEKIQNAETDEEREMYEKELYERMLMLNNWYG